MRNISQFFTKQTLSYLLYLPRVFTTIKHPVGFLKSYITGGLSIDTICLRRGQKYNIANFDDLGVFYEIFIKREYGKIPQGKITVVDIGANNGLFTLYCKWQNPQATIHCYEPIPACAEHIRQMAKDNGRDDIHVHEAAVADQSGEQQLYLNEQITVAASLYQAVAGAEYAINIKTTSFADLLSEDNIETIDFLKVDCEGGEYSIFSDISAETLDRCKYIAIEYHDIDEQKTGKKLFNYLHRLVGEKRRVLFHPHPAHPHNGFITIK